LKPARRVWFSTSAVIRQITHHNYTFEWIGFCYAKYVLDERHGLVAAEDGRRASLRVPAMQKAFVGAWFGIYPDQHINDIDADAVYHRQVIGTGQAKTLFIVALGIGLDATYLGKRSLGETKPAAFGP
jgi:hypothetical protein